MKIITVLMLIFLLSGSGSISEHASGCYREYYQGTQEMVGAGCWVYLPWLDVPFSAVLDTVTLPVDSICIANH